MTYESFYTDSMRIQWLRRRAKWPHFRCSVTNERIKYGTFAYIRSDTGTHGGKNGTWISEETLILKRLQNKIGEHNTEVISTLTNMDWD